MPNRGFTLTELIVTIVVASILAAVILPRWYGETGFEERGFRDETMAALRFAQKAAVGARRVVCATVAADQVYFQISSQAPEASSDCSQAVQLLVANGSNSVLGSKYGGMTFATPATFPTTIIFDAAGRNTGAQVVLTVTNLANQPITVEAETGYVH